MVALRDGVGHHLGQALFLRLRRNLDLLFFAVLKKILPDVPLGLLVTPQELGWEETGGFCKNIFMLYMRERR